MTQMTTRLHPGDRRIRAVVRPQFPTDLVPGWTWPCSVCRVWFDAHLTHAVLYGGPDLAVPYAFMVCSDCAGPLTPLRLRLDRHRLLAMARVLGSDDGTDHATRLVADHVTVVLAMRAGPPLDVVSLRAIDAHLLAGRLETTRSALIALLEGTGALVGVEVASEAVAVSAA